MAQAFGALRSLVASMALVMVLERQRAALQSVFPVQSLVALQALLRAASLALRLRMSLAALGRLAMLSAPSPKVCAAFFPATALNRKSSLLAA